MTTTNSGTDPGTGSGTPARGRGLRLHRSLWIGAAMLLAFPALATAMGEAQWGLEDFAAMALALALLCGAIEAALRWLDAPRWRIGAILLAVLMLLTVWAHMAIGLFD